MCEILALKLQAVLRNLTGQMKLSMGNRNKPLDYVFFFFDTISGLLHTKLFHCMDLNCLRYHVMC